MSEQSLCTDFEYSFYSKIQEQDAILVISTIEQSRQILNESIHVCVGRLVLCRSTKRLILVDSCSEEG